MKKFILKSVLVGALAYTGTAAADAVITFDPAADGTTTTLLDNFSVDLINDEYEVQQYFHGGANDLVLDEGDVFTETFTYNVNFSTLDGADLQFWSLLEFEFNLSGHIEDVTYGLGGAPDLSVLGDANPSNDLEFFDNFSDTSFRTVFDPTENGLIIRYDGDVIAQMDVLQGISQDPISLGGDTLNSGFIFQFDFNEDWVTSNTALFESVWQDAQGNPFNDDNPFSFAIATGNAGPTGDAFATQNGSPLFVQDDGGVNDGRTYFSVGVKDGGGDIVFADIPEPSSIAILGLGLLGLARIRRQA